MQKSTLWMAVIALFAGTLSLDAEWKFRAVDPATRVSKGRMATRSAAPSGGHYMLAEDREALVEARGGRVVARVPGTGIVAVLPAGVEGFEEIEPESKISPQVERAGMRIGHFLVEFFPDVASGDRELVAIRAGFVIRAHPDLSPNHVLVQGPAIRLARLAREDAVAYIFPASEDLVRGEPVVACLSAGTGSSATGQYIAAVGEGWDGPGRNAAVLSYSLGSLTDRLAPSVIRSIVDRTLAEWSKAAQITFTPGGVAGARRNLNLLFAKGAHEDDYPFDGPGKVLAHTFYPNPPVSEPIAGDLHLDAQESWNSGADIDLFSVVLHELGHALGLAHADTPNAVMYPYYRRVLTLSTTDTASIQQLYAAPAGTTTGTTDPPGPTTPAVAPLQIGLMSTAVSSAVATFRGSASGGGGVRQVLWTNAGGASGIATGTTDWSAQVPLARGDNPIRFTAVGVNGSQASLNVVVSWNPVVTDRTAPGITISSPGVSSVLTASSFINLSGTAWDNVAVTAIRWSTNAGASGVASGLATWRVEGIPLLIGTNVIIVRAYDAAGNTSWRSITVTRR